MTKAAPRQESIHPRVYHGVEGRKKDTFKRKTKSVTERKIAAIEGHLERQPGDGRASQHLAKLRGAL